MLVSVFYLLDWFNSENCRYIQQCAHPSLRGLLPVLVQVRLTRCMFSFFLWEQCMFSFLIRAPCKSQFQVFFFLSRMSKKVKTRELLVPRSAECSLLSSSTPTHPRALMIFRAPWKACLLILHQTNGCILPCLKVFAAAAVNRTAVGAFTRIVLLLAHILAACRLAIFRGEAPKQWWRHWWRLRAWACGAYT